MKNKKYKVRIGGVIKEEEVQEIGELINSIEQKKGGIKPLDLLKLGKNKKNILHKYFEWDNTKASHQYRLQQARSIISSVVVEFTELTDQRPLVRAFVNISDKSKGEKKYVSLMSGLKEEDWKNQIISKAKTELENWAIRYRQYNELANLIEVIEKNL